jgi:hypothetical protein
VNTRGWTQPAAVIAVAGLSSLGTATNRRHAGVEQDTAPAEQLRETVSAMGTALADMRALAASAADCIRALLVMWGRSGQPLHIYDQRGAQAA